MGAALPFVTAAATGLQAFGQIQQGKAAANAANYNSEIAGNNATIARQNATFAGEEGEEKAAQEEQQTRGRVGALVANEGAAGLDVNSGSDVNVRASASETGMLDALNIRSNAARQAYGYQTQASSYDAQAKLDKQQAKQDKTAGYIGAFTSVLGSTASAGMNGAYDSWLGNSALPTSVDTPTFAMNPSDTDVPSYMQGGG